MNATDRQAIARFLADIANQADTLRRRIDVPDELADIERLVQAARDVVLQRGSDGDGRSYTSTRAMNRLQRALGRTDGTQEE